MLLITVCIELVDLDIKINQLNNQIATEKVSRNNCEKELFRLKIILEEKKVIKIKKIAS